MSAGRGDRGDSAIQYRVTMMEWFNSPTPFGRERSWRWFGKQSLGIGMVGEKSLSWIRLQKPAGERDD